MTHNINILSSYKGLGRDAQTSRPLMFSSFNRVIRPKIALNTYPLAKAVKYLNEGSKGIGPY